jgi:hypothetical protein
MKLTKTDYLLLFAILLLGILSFWPNPYRGQTPQQILNH